MSIKYNKLNKNYETITAQEIYDNLTDLQQYALNLDEVEEILETYKSLTNNSYLAYKLTRHTISLTSCKRNKNGNTYISSLLHDSYSSDIIEIYLPQIVDLFLKLDHHDLEPDKVDIINEHITHIKAFSKARKLIILRFAYEITGFKKELPEEALKINKLFKQLGIA